MCHVVMCPIWDNFGTSMMSVTRNYETIVDVKKLFWMKSRFLLKPK